jgi:rod shape-determining protein MreD
VLICDVMYLKIISYIVLVPFIFAVQTAFINGLPMIFHFNLIIVSAMVILLVFGWDEALWSSIGFGFLYDLYGFNNFGVNIIILPVIVFSANLLLIKFFTNKSLYSFLALVLFGSIFYDIIIWGIDMGRIDGLFNKTGFQSLNLIPEFLPILLNLLAVTFAFYIINYISDRLKPVFLIKNQKI